MPGDQPIIDEHTTATVAADPPRASASEAIKQDEVCLDDTGELPPRPRRRVLTPLPLALLAALAIACGFIAGVLVEKGQGGSTSAGGSGSGIAARLATLRGGSTRSGSGSGSGSGGVSSTSGVGGGFSPVGSASAGATIGQVAFVSKGTLYVTTSEGDTVKVRAAAGANVTKTVKAKVASIHPGETVLVTGAAGASGAIAASSIRVGLAGTSGLRTGAGALFSASGGAASSSSSSGGGSSRGSGSEPQLFGDGG